MIKLTKRDLAEYWIYLWNKRPLSKRSRRKTSRYFKIFTIFGWSGHTRGYVDSSKSSHLGSRHRNAGFWSTTALDSRKPWEATSAFVWLGYAEMDWRKFFGVTKIQNSGVSRAAANCRTSCKNLLEPFITRNKQRFPNVILDSPEFFSQKITSHFGRFGEYGNRGLPAYEVRVIASLHRWKAAFQHRSTFSMRNLQKTHVLLHNRVNSRDQQVKSTGTRTDYYGKTRAYCTKLSLPVVRVEMFPETNQFRAYPVVCWFPSCAFLDFPVLTSDVGR